jgi:hypothetical protein
MKKIYFCFLFNLSFLIIAHAQWALNGNAIAAGNFLGTTNNQNLVFKADSINAGLIDVSYKNTFFGLYSGGTASSTATQNSAFGMYALQNNSTGYANVAVGYLSLPQNTSGNTNVAVGAEALYTNSTGYANVAIGPLALYYNTSGNSNNAIGINALQRNTSGVANDAHGSYSLYSNTTGTANCAMGYQSLYSNTVGTYNCAVGYQALFSNINGQQNTAIGYQALYNSTNQENTAVGYQSMFANTTGYANSAVGMNSLLSNNSGYNNTAIGVSSMTQNTTGQGNSALGNQSLYTNTTGSSNVAVGSNALEDNTTGQFNVGVGVLAGAYNATGSENTYVGYNAGPYSDSTNLTNTTALGYGAKADTSNIMVFGNTSITHIYAAVTGIKPISDGRFKKNIKENVPGLAFIKLLKPITFNYDIKGLNAHLSPAKSNTTSKEDQEGIAQKESILYTGLVAQDVESAINKVGYTFSGLDKPLNDHGIYRLNYTDFVMPLIKAAQELSNNNDTLKLVIDSLKTAQAAMQTQINSIAQQVNSLRTTAFFENSPLLQQNEPAPSNNTTVINYYLPLATTNAQLTITDTSGHILRNVVLNNASGQGQAIINAGELASGTYFYSLLLNGKSVDTKRMILTK